MKEIHGFDIDSYENTSQVKRRGKSATAISWDSFNHHFICKAYFIGLSKVSC